MRVSCWRPFLALGGRDSRDDSLISGDDLAENRGSPQPLPCDSWTLGWPRWEHQAPGNRSSAHFALSQIGRATTPEKHSSGPPTPVKESWGSVWEKGVSVCPYLRGLSLGHPSLGAARHDHTGGIAEDQPGTVPEGPW